MKRAYGTDNGPVSVHIEYLFELSGMTRYDGGTE